ncbi:uncharacterized protein LOC112571924 [Pomacea canaliculata]|uniref:uncharacterized protein LOC112571924 n=1 Tax=Pomacea canaliculata TaxID=400727 RepID=UPI000D736F72|nr:uncharacterized protein LOC112571924 [Pomacea canaliculata]
MKMDSVSRCYNLIWLRMLLMCVIFCVVRAQERKCQCQKVKGCNWTPRKEAILRKRAIAKENVAVGKPAKITSTHKDPASGPACLAVDGSRATKYTTEKGKLSCVSSGRDDKAPVWEVNLNGTYQITLVNVYWDEETKDKHSGAILHVGARQCNVFKEMNTNPSVSWCNLVGNIVKISLTGGKVGSDNFLRLCEVEIWVCYPGFFGKYCNDSCSSKCGDNMACDLVTGKCKTPIIEPPEECTLPPKALLIAALSIPIGLIIFIICRLAGSSKEDTPPEETEEGEKVEGEGEEGEKEGEGKEGGEEAASEAGPDNE